MKRYNPKDIEPRWQAQWEADKIYQASEDTAKPKKYVLEYFPYPSGAAMHVGHVRNYTIGDVIARFNRMNGYNVLHPMGWDAFGLPAENYAIKNHVSPRKAIDENTARFKQQLIQMGFSYDWSREIDSTDPKYYRWTQWLFLMLFKRGLAYQQEALVNWDPIDKTVLANEQVIDGKAERSGAVVEKKSLKQWFFKITDYADRLLDDLDDLDWSTSIKTMQRNWIGRSKGAEIDFVVEQPDLQRPSAAAQWLTVFTTRPDTLYGATFLVVAPEHSWANDLATPDRAKEVNNYIFNAQNKSDIERMEQTREKTGVFTGSYAINPLSKEKIPIWIADYVLGSYGTGAIMAVPAHDERDWEFAKKYDLPIRRVVQNSAPDEECTHAEGVMINSGKYDGQPSQDMREQIVADITELNVGAEHQLAREKVQYKMRDWLISRQRYWGAPIPIIHCSNCAPDKVKNNVVAIIEFADHRNFKHLLTGEKTAITRAQDEDKTPEYFDIKEDGIVKLIDKQTDDALYARVIKKHFYKNISELFADKSLLKASFVQDFASEQALREQYDSNRPEYSKLIDNNGVFGWEIELIKMPIAVPEDQLPVVLPEVESYHPSGDGRSPLANVPEFVNTTCPECGGPAERETDTMDGFACSSWYFLRFADPHNDEAPFARDKADFWLPVDDYIGGAEHAVMHLLYARFWTKVMYDEKLINFQEPFMTLRNQGMILAPNGVKMSKSKGNTIEPDSIIDQGYGADSIRIMELFIGPWNQTANWSVEGMGGCFRFLQRVWTLVQEFNEADKKSGAESVELRRTIHKTVKKVSGDMLDLGFNTSIAALMECVNELYRIKAADNYTSQDWQFALETFLQLLAPFAPHVAEELWQQLGHDTSIHTSQWPGFDEKYLAEDTVMIAIQVNGKLRGEAQVASGASEEDVVQAAQANQKVAGYLDGQTIRKTIYVPGKLVNFVI